jgi:membrane associated rhomboid family serine protease
MGSGIEFGIGFAKMSFLYILTGFGGNLLSSVANPAAFGVGASTAVFGLVGFYVAYLFTNWQ